MHTFFRIIWLGLISLTLIYGPIACGEGGTGGTNQDSVSKVLDELETSTRPLGDIAGKWWFVDYEWVDETGYVENHQAEILQDIAQKRGTHYMHFRPDGGFAAVYSNPLDTADHLVEGTYRYAPREQKLHMTDD